MAREGPPRRSAAQIACALAGLAVSTGIRSNFPAVARQPQLAELAAKALEIQIPSFNGCQDKILIATRHAQAQHNVCEAWVKAGRPLAYEGFSEQYIQDILAWEASGGTCLSYDPFLDAALSEAGVAMASTQGRAMLQDALAGAQPAAVFVSSLRRTMTTAAILYRDNSTPLHALDLIVEKRTRTPADQRRPLSMLKSNLDLLKGREGVLEQLAGDSVVRLLEGVGSEELYTDVRLRDGSIVQEGPATDATDVNLLKTPVQGGLVSDAYYFGDGKKENDDGVDVRALNWLRYIATLPAETFPVIGMVSHKGFLREMELVAGLYDDLGGKSAAQKRKTIKSLNDVKGAKQKRAAEGKAAGEYPNAATRVYYLRCVKG
eukprot:TRINITY_DN65883_c0_g1_i1.p1 TRINITY_DN65883_c0_g1~~TRINITY_DN65883_c0_g1_i1.p1  ORF type:complete len:376 (+),score=57.33 TRINITY_DN65883_c0_g1_i1:128-1255(+)